MVRRRKSRSRKLGTKVYGIMDSPRRVDEVPDRRVRVPSVLKDCLKYDDTFSSVLTVLAQSWALIFTLFLALAVANKLCVEVNRLVTEETVKKTPP
jgi:hypothetical protein